MMVLAEFNLIARTSVVTLSVLGIIKVGDRGKNTPEIFVHLINCL